MRGRAGAPLNPSSGGGHQQSQTLLHHLRWRQAGPGYRLDVVHPPSARPGTGLLDAARGPLHPAAVQTLASAVAAGWADPTRLNPPGRRARGLLDQAREVLATGLGASPAPDAATRGRPAAREPLN